MWANRITLDFVKHEAARAKVLSKLKEIGATDEWITDLHISADAGYVHYTITLSDKSSFTVFDDGNMFNGRFYPEKLKLKWYQELIGAFKNRRY